jgi:hypothetical protein
MTIPIHSWILIAVGGLLLLFAFIEFDIVKPACEGMQSNWEIAENSFKDDECLDTWDEITGGIKSVLSLDKFGQSDRKALIENKNTEPEFKVCIQKAPNYTLECPPDLLEVAGCNGKKYKNACFAERDGVYSYVTSNGFKATE